MRTSEHLEKYLEYITNVGGDGPTTTWFDDDWEPIGPMVREELDAAGLVKISASGHMQRTDKKP